nr:MAG TPA: hypothetical protein [Caudoviricetes sp.]
MSTSLSVRIAAFFCPFCLPSIYYLCKQKHLT